MTDDHVHPETLFHAIAAYIADSRQMLGKGETMELAGLDERVQALCGAVLQLSQDERVEYADHLQYLLNELQALGDAMMEQRDMVAAEIKHLNQHKKANVAYRIVEASDNKEDES